MNTKPITIVAAAAVLAVLAGCGATAPAPAEAETETKTVTEEVEVTPQSCLDALDASDELDGLMGDALDSAGRAMEAQGRLDSYAIDEETAYLQDLLPDVERVRSEYDDAAAECRGGGL